MENTSEEFEKFKKESFIKLLGYEGISNEKANEIYESFGGDSRKMASAISLLAAFKKLDVTTYLRTIGYLAHDDIESVAKTMLNN